MQKQLRRTDASNLPAKRKVAKQPEDSWMVRRGVDDVLMMSAE